MYAVPCLVLSIIAVWLGILLWLYINRAEQNNPSEEGCAPVFPRFLIVCCFLVSIVLLILAWR